ncbi:MAG TPA: ROK family protein, partial [Solirubrobacteraceae bacterium]
MPHETVKRHMYDAIVAGEKPKPTPALIEAINRGPYRGLFALRDGAWTWGQKVPSALAIVVTREALCVARVDAAGNLSLLQRRVAPLVPRHGRTDSPKGYAKRLSGVFRAMRDSADFESLAPPAGIAVSWPAPIGVDDDALGQGEPLERDRDSAKTWDGVSVRKLIADAAFEQFTVRLPVRLVNDANAELLAEAAHGVATDDESAVLIKLSGGIGGATMLKRYLHAGEGRIG